VGAGVLLAARPDLEERGGDHIHSQDALRSELVAPGKQCTPSHALLTRVMASEDEGALAMTVILAQFPFPRMEWNTSRSCLGETHGGRERCGNAGPAVREGGRGPLNSMFLG
jgi:hypothetical protein